jgi:hypothetical protein
MKFNFLLFSFLSCFIFQFNLQAQEVEINGKIEALNEETSFVNIINLSQKKGDISNKDGKFLISVQLNDTLLFSSVQFEKLELVVTEEMIQNQFLEIFLDEKNTLLKEVVLNPYGLTGDLEKDAQNMPSYVFDYKAAGLKPPRKPLTQTERRIYTASSTSIDYLLNSINGRIKKLRQLQEWNRLDELKEDIQERIPKEYFSSDLGIEEKYVEDFIYFCLENNALQYYVRNHEDLEIIEYLRLKADAYKIIKNNETASH